MVLFSDDGSPTPAIDWCYITITADQVAELLESLRKNILDALELKSGGVREFYDAEPAAVAEKKGRLPKPRKVSDKICRLALEKLTKVGRRIDSSLFDSDRDPVQRQRALRLRRRLRDLSRSKRLRLQILSADVSVPWNLMYDGHTDAKPDPELFWGFRHIIEELPYRAQTPAVEALSRQGGLLLGLNLNRNNLKHALIEPQVEVLSQRVTLIKERTSEAEVLDMLSLKQDHGRIEYFYCHAGADGTRTTGYEQSYLGMTSATQGLTLEDINLAAYGLSFQDRPLFILNACESAQMDGRFYDGFVPRLLKMGAAAVVGTECKVPEVLGAHLGLRLVEGLLDGDPLGETLRSARLDFLEKYNNPFGLLYRSFGNSDVHFVPS